MAECNIDISTLPEDVRDKLAELDLELSEGKQAVWRRSTIDFVFVWCITATDHSRILETPAVFVLLEILMKFKNKLQAILNFTQRVNLYFLSGGETKCYRDALFIPNKHSTIILENLLLDFKPVANEQSTILFYLLLWFY